MTSLGNQSRTGCEVLPRILNEEEIHCISRYALVRNINSMAVAVGLVFEKQFWVQ